MIVFDLRCGRAHVFEAWFGSTADYEAQRGRGLIACPLCDDTAIDKAAMAPAVAAKGNRADKRSGGDAAAALAAQRRMEAAAEYVGEAFATEARALHADGAPTRAIYGEATLAEATALLDEGIAVMPLPFRPLVRSDA